MTQHVVLWLVNKTYIDIIQYIKCVIITIMDFIKYIIQYHVVKIVNL